MILKIAIQTPQNSRYCYIDKLPDPLPAYFTGTMVTKINDRAAYLMSELRPGIMVGSSLVDEGFIVSFSSKPYDRTRTEVLLSAYARHLKEVFEANPEIYGHDYFQTRERMKIAILEGSYNKDSEALKRTCKELKIKHTYKAIQAFLEGN